MSEPRTLLDGRVVLHNGDCREVLRGMEDNSIDSVCTDPPYALVSIGKRFGKDGASPAKSNGATGVYARASKGFMGCRWDTGATAFDPDLWADVCRVMKPGANAFIFGGDRTYHRLVCGVEDGGLEIRRTFVWAYGMGFPKSHNIALDYEKTLCEQVEINGRVEWRYKSDGALMCRGGQKMGGGNYSREAKPDNYRHPAAIEWDGFGTDVKPAVELICLARKPLSEPSIAANVRRWGVGAINVGATKISLSSPQRDDPSFVWLSQLYSSLDRRPLSRELSLYSLRYIVSALRSYNTDSNGHARNGADQNGTLPSDDPDNEKFLGLLLASVSWCDLNWKEVLNSLGDCPLCHRFYDEHIRLFEAVSQESAASLADALSRMCTAQHEPLCIHEHQPIDRLSNSLALFLIAKCIAAHTTSLSRHNQDGRWPSNLILDGSDDVLACFPETGASDRETRGDKPYSGGMFGDSLNNGHHPGHNDSGSAARFFASFPQDGNGRDGEASENRRYADRGATTFTQTPGRRQEPVPASELFASFPQDEESVRRIFYTSKADADDRLASKHPTVKPLSLLQYLVRLITPKNGVCLDLFAGTGTTAEACFREGFRAILIEREDEYIADIERRLSLVMEGQDTRKYASMKARNRPRDDGPLFGGSEESPSHPRPTGSLRNGDDGPFGYDGKPEAAE